MASTSTAPGSIITGLNPTTVNLSDPFVLFVIQAVIIIGLCYILHFGLRRLNQPRVISEVIAGVILGPSAMGRIPGFANTIFNPASLPFLNLVSNLGLVLFLFLVGLELDPVQVLRRARFALGISFAGMALPLGVGAAVSYVLFVELGPNTTVGFGEFLLFCGVAMSITAFPVLARILAEQKLLTTKVGFLTVCAGAVGDIVAWILLALVVSIINSSSRIAPLYVILLSIAWILVLVFAIRPLFALMIRITKSQDEPSQTMMAFTLAVVLISAFLTDIIGVHAIFGAFLVGLVIPNDTGFADGATKRIEDLVSVIFLPIYFALSGLKTQVGLLDNGKIWGLVILTTAVACFGKIIGCSVAARLQGMEWRESFAVGFLMNCKGLIELIVLNIGYDAGVINDKVFVIMVAMCLITTCMTTPAVSLLYPVHYQRAAAMRAAAKKRMQHGDLERPGSLETTDRTNKGFVLCLDKIHNLPAMMTFLEMLHYAVPGNRSAGGSNSFLSVPECDTPLNQPNQSENATGPRLLALRLLHLTDRSSSVLLAATERAEVLHRDAVMTVFQAFAKLNGIFVRPRMTLSTDPDDFAHSIYDEAVENSADVIIVPWNSSSLPDPSMSHTDQSQNPILSRPLVTSNTRMVARLLSTTANKGLVTAVFVDREFGGSGHFLNTMILLYGSHDDEEALKLASAMSHNDLCNVIIVRVATDKVMTKKEETAGVLIDVDSQSIDSVMDDLVTILPQDNQVLVQDYFPHRAFANGDRRANNKQVGAKGSNEIGARIFIHDVPTIQDAIGLSKLLLGSRGLLVLGRGLTSKRADRRPAMSIHMPDLSQSQSVTVHGIPTDIQASSTSPSLHHHNLPTGFAVSTLNTPTQHIDNPLGGHDHSESGYRHRHQLRPQPSSRDLHHSSLTVATIVGVVAQSFLASEVVYCLLAVQSGAKHASGEDYSRVHSSVAQDTLHTPGQGNSNDHPSGEEGSRGLGLEMDQVPTYTTLEHLHVVDDKDEKRR
ncbi:Sodium/hydrogen exchanger family-domain-containing protein [Dissophora ornata]|nr:Sodium/hydrogen exchanger family-domain-containing protein [Dissophora ornata]